MKILFTTIIGLILLAGVVYSQPFYQRMPNDFTDPFSMCVNEPNTYRYDLAVATCQPNAIGDAWFWNDTLTGYSDVTEEINYTTYGTLMRQVGVRTDDLWWIDYGIAPEGVVPVDCSRVPVWYPLANYTLIPVGTFTWFNETNLTTQNWSIIDNVCWRFRGQVVGIPDIFTIEIDGFHVDVEVIVHVVVPVETEFFISEFLIILFVVLVFTAVKLS